jgi:hypothetical protein
MERLRIATWIFVALIGGLGAGGWAAQPAAAQHLISGIVHNIDGAKFSLETRAGKTVRVDATAAIRAERSVTFYEGAAVSAAGTLDKKGVLQAESVNRIKSARAMWPEDR